MSQFDLKLLDIDLFENQETESTNFSIDFQNEAKNIDNLNTISSTISVHPFVAKSYLTALSNYSLLEIKLILKTIKKLDSISKGIYRINNDENSLLLETLFKIFIKK